ncbi:MAG TPA: cache domain-containing protein [Spirochaetota bacterium]|nr:cache domain-containing protein [Spirochaetota bacterium]
MTKIKQKFRALLSMLPGVHRRSGLRARLFLSYLIPALLILAITGVFTFIIVGRGLKNNLHKEMESSTESVRLMVENSLDLSIRSHLRGIADINRDIVAGLYSQYRRGLISEAEARRKAGSILLSQKIGKTGYIFVWNVRRAPEKILLAVHPFTRGKDVSGFEFVRKGAEIKNGYMKYRWRNPGDERELDKAMYLSHFAPWNWVIAASSYRSEFTELISIDDFREKILSIKFGSRGYYFVINSKGDVIIHPSLTGNFFNTIDREGKKFVQEMCSKKNGEITYYWPEPGETTPRKKLSIYRYIPDLDWIVISSSYPDEYNITLSRVRSIIITSLVVLIVILSIATYFSGSRIITPLRALMEKLREGAAGDYRLHLPVESGDEFGELAAHFNSFMDEIRAGRDGLVSAQNYLNSIINSLPSVLAAVDADGKVRLWNKGAEIFTGTDTGSAESENIYRLFPFLEQFRNSIEATITSKTTAEFRCRGNSKTGDDRELHVSIYPFSQQEMNIAVIRMDDITDYVRKDAQLLQAQKMEIVGNLAGGLAHDFNNVLAGIIGTVSLMKYYEKRGIKDGNTAKYLNIIESSARRAADIVDQLLAISRKNEPSMQPLDINRSLENVMTICRNSLDKSIEITPSYYGEAAVINGSAAQIEQVMLNICINAAHAMTIMRNEGEARGGVLTASISRVSADESFRGSHPGAGEGTDYISVRISDTGVGISREAQDKIFDPFFTTKSKDKGTGLGLLMVYRIIEAHNGFIDLQSEPGRGTAFTIYLPAAEGVPSESESDFTDIEDLKGRGGLLIIDDEDTVRETAKGLLEECGYTVYTAPGGAEGINFLRENTGLIKLVILDMSMPGLSGRDVFIELKKINEDIPVLLASGFKYDERVQETIQLGVDDFIQKPYSLKELAVKVNKIIGGCGSS